MAAVLPIKLQKLTSRNHPFIHFRFSLLPNNCRVVKKAEMKMKGILTKKLTDSASIKRVIVTFSYTKMKLLGDKINIKMMVGH